MGLDMYLYGNKRPEYDYANDRATREEDGYRVEEVSLRLGYWRKHADLHGYIVRTFAEGEDTCQEILLTKEDLQVIISAVEDASLPHTEGFFFRYGGYDPKEQAAEDKQILTGAHKWLLDKPEKEYRYVIYQASW